MSQPTPGVPPPLRVRDHAWRLALCLVFSAALFGSVAQQEWESHRFMWWTEISVGVLAYVLVVFRRRHPVLIAVVVALLSTVSGVAAGPASLAAVSASTRRRWREVLLVGSANTAAGLAYGFVAPFPIAGPEDTLVAMSSTIGLNVALVGWGMFIGSRRELVANLEQRALRAEAEQELRLGRARATERTRIAREMHDVVAHRISLVSLQAGALAFREDLEAPRLRAGLEEIQGLANTALDELRGVLGVLREESGDGGTLAPQPTYADIRTLLEEARESGMRITRVDRVADPVLVPTTVGRTLYRIVQEGTTNARKHAPGHPLHVLLRGGPQEGITVVLRNPLHPGASAAPGSGLGLVGLRERAELSAGRLEQRVEDDHFVLEGWLPWQN
ncbi:MAG: sensor histidine kinase [Nocardioides sp.]|uniref:sensor histidine kinase n=1 Tax=Nocardioides sp. TaxID=35761 RepID=UPI003F0C3561